ncbi:hypothetical protein LTR86_007951 [Recurvomyces mirabilis]|nr:hypothetical protein LTR86_007951 [Recurvomyces mirabilis]
MSYLTKPSRTTDAFASRDDAVTIERSNEQAYERPPEQSHERSHERSRERSHERSKQSTTIDDASKDIDRTPTSSSTTEIPNIDFATPRADSTAQTTEQSRSSSTDFLDASEHFHGRPWESHRALDLEGKWPGSTQESNHYSDSPEQYSQNSSQDSALPTSPPAYATNERQNELLDDAGAQFKSDLAKPRHFLLAQRALSLQSDTDTSYHTADSGYNSGRSNTSRPTDRALDFITDVTVLLARQFVRFRKSTDLLDTCITPFVSCDETLELLRSFCQLLRVRAGTTDEIAACTLVEQEIGRVARAFCEISQNPTIIVPEAEAWQEDHGHVRESQGRFRAMLESQHNIGIMSTFSPLSASNYDTALAFVTEGEEFIWVISELCITQSNMSTGPEMLKVRNALVDSICWKHEEGCSITLEWCLRTFLKEQYPSVDTPTLDDCIAYCGMGDEIEAVFVRDYMARMWPVIGEQLLSTLKTAVSMKEDSKSVEPLPTPMNNASLRLKSRDGHLEATIHGSPIAQLQFAEALVWLGAACRASPHASTAYCAANLARSARKAEMKVSYSYTLIDIPPPACEKQSGLLSRSPATTTKAPGIDDRPASAFCWLSLVRNPSVALGYPVVRRKNNERGLEIPLAILITIATANRAAIFNCVTVIKSFCSMLVATRHVDGSACWHYIFDDPLKPASYSKAPSCTTEDTRGVFETLQDSRHFVGWSNVTTTSIGTKDCSYDIGHTGTNYSQAGLGFDGVTVSASKYISVATKIVPGIKDTVLFHRVPDNYRMQLKSAETMRVVLYDVPTSRAWLVDGAEALLYLSRAYLSSHHVTSAERRRSLRLVQAFTHRSEAVSVDNTASGVLLESGNRTLDLDQDDDCPDLNQRAGSNKQASSNIMPYQHLVAHFYELLAEIQGHFDLMHRSQKLNIGPVRNWGVNTLEGVDFADLVKLHTVIKPRTITLQESAKMWLPMTEHMSAMHLFGSGFGEVIKAPHTCAGYRQVPYGLDLLASSARLLNTVAAQLGGGHAHSLRIAGKAWWNMPLEVFEHKACCASSPQSTKSKLSPHHVLQPEDWHPWPPRVPRSSSLSEYLNLFPSAAVILGSKARVSKTPVVRPTIETNGSIWPTQAVGLRPAQSSATSTDMTTLARSLTSSLGAGYASTAATSVQASPASRTQNYEESEKECDSGDLNDAPYDDSNNDRGQDLRDVSMEALWAEIARRAPSSFKEIEVIGEDRSQLKRAGDEPVAERPSKIRRLSAEEPQLWRRSRVADLGEQFRMGAG